jgi:hypothetical protein
MMVGRMRLAEVTDAPQALPAGATVVTHSMTVFF